MLEKIGGVLGLFVIEEKILGKGQLEIFLFTLYACVLDRFFDGDVIDVHPDCYQNRKNIYDDETIFGAIGVSEYISFDGIHANINVILA